MSKACDVLELLVRDLFDPTKKIPDAHRDKYIYLLADPRPGGHETRRPPTQARHLMTPPPAEMGGGRLG